MNARSACALLCLLLAGATFAGPRPHTHDGFFLRLAPGFGGASSSYDDADGEVSLDGGAGIMDIAIGAMVSESLALHATLFGWSISDPDAEFDYSDGTSLDGEVPGDFTLGAFGIGVTNYFGPSNVYLSASLGAGSLTLDVEGLGDFESDTGFAGEIACGKEWWVGNNWGLGVAGVFGFHSIPDADTDEKFSGGNFGVLFSATFN